MAMALDSLKNSNALYVLHPSTWICRFVVSLISSNFQTSFPKIISYVEKQHQAGKKPLPDVVRLAAKYVQDSTGAVANQMFNIR
eukprot:469169-Amorphochlora_amoeboformis.AAC.1